MQTAFQLPKGADLALITMRICGPRQTAVLCHSPFLDDVDYSDSDAVAAAREAVLQMIEWDDFVGYAIQGGREEEARQAIADVVICQLAAVWEESGPGRIAAAGAGAEALLRARTAFFSVLSSYGVAAMTARYEVVIDGIQYQPATGNDGVDDLLAMVVQDDVVKALREFAPDASEVIETLDAHMERWRFTECRTAEARRWMDAGSLNRAGRHFDIAAVADEKAAAAWAAGGRPLIAASAYGQATQDWLEAIAYWGVNQYARAARASEMAARSWRACGRLHEEASAYETAAQAWQGMDEHARAALAYEREATVLLELEHTERAAERCGAAAMSWRDAREPTKAAAATERQAQYLGRAAQAWRAIGRPEFAVPVWKMQAESWTEAGFPDRAARSWRRALLDAGTDETYADEVRAAASALFDIDLTDEETLNE